MRQINVLTFVSMDGVMQGPGGPEEDTRGDFRHGGWTAGYFDELVGQEMVKGDGAASSTFCSAVGLTTSSRRTGRR